MKLTVYRATDGWRWRLRAANGRIVADSAEAYRRRRDAVAIAQRIAASPITVAVDDG